MLKFSKKINEIFQIPVAVFIRLIYKKKLVIVQSGYISFVPRMPPWIPTIFNQFRREIKPGRAEESRNKAFQIYSSALARQPGCPNYLAT